MTGSAQGLSDFSIKNHKRTDVFTVYPHCVVFEPKKKDSSNFTRRISPRGKIREFTKRARFRLFVTMSKITDKLHRSPLFVSMTYHYGHSQDDTKHQKDLHHFLVDLRRFDPGCQYIWRLEYQKRGAPHFHMIIFPAKSEREISNDSYVHNLNLLWHAVADPLSKAHMKYGVKTVVINDYRMACSYINKYVAKIEDGYEAKTQGKQWGNSRNLPFKVDSVIACNKGNSAKILSKLRAWLFKHGKAHYAHDTWFNENRPQIIFIDPEEFENIVKEASRGSTDWKKYPYDIGLSGFCMGTG